MRPIGFSTGALALGDFRRALDMLRSLKTKAIELSALRDHEVAPLMKTLRELDLRGYCYISVHAPSAFRSLPEEEVAMHLSPCVDLNIPVVVHPDAIKDLRCWQRFGSLLCIENMDKRKSTGRTTQELEGFFSALPDATFCFDMGHARQVDSTMGEARRMLRRFGPRLRQIHFSEIDAQGHHHGATQATVLASRNIVELIGPDIPTIIESQVSSSEIARELSAVEKALELPTNSTSNQTIVDWGALA